MAYKDPNRQREYAREWMAARRAAWLAANGPCVRCGSTLALHVDHVDPSTKVSHNVWSWSQVRREAELAKCQVLCRSCHESKTGKENQARMGGPLRHGTESMYGKGKCRCDPCRQARRWAKAANRARRKSLGLPYQ